MLTNLFASMKFREGAIQATMKTHGVGRFQAVRTYNEAMKCEVGKAAHATGYTVEVIQKYGLDGAALLGAGMPLKLLASGDENQKLGAFDGHIINGILNWLNDPANIDKINNAIANIMKLIAIILPLFVHATKRGKFGDLPTPTPVISIQLLQQEVGDLNSAQSDAQAKFLLAQGALAALNSLITANTAQLAALQAQLAESETAAKTASELATTDFVLADQIVRDELTYITSIIQGTPGADPTPSTPVVPSPVPTPIPDPAPSPDPAPPAPSPEPDLPTAHPGTLPSNAIR